MYVHAHVLIVNNVGRGGDKSGVIVFDGTFTLLRKWAQKQGRKRQQQQKIALISS